MSLLPSFLTAACFLYPAHHLASQEPSHRLQVEVFKGDFATVNSFIFSNGRSLVVMDVQRKTSEAKKLADIVKSKGLPLTHVLITHGHTDHFTGMDWFHKEFPAAQIVVASEEIKQDIKNYAIYMDTGERPARNRRSSRGCARNRPATPTALITRTTFMCFPVTR
jgi:glyoxylase-like metal-dependent hydrolase (beta-lactamase superfamily II)